MAGIHALMIGLGARVSIGITIPSPLNTPYVLDLAKASGMGYQAGISDITLTINSTISSNSTSTPALTIASDWHVDDKIFVINNSIIYGMGGNGGRGGFYDYYAGVYGTPWLYPVAGTGGGTAVKANRAVTFNNLGTINGGGGGGGGGGERGTYGEISADKSNYYLFIGGGGGGRGASGTVLASVGYGGTPNISGNGLNAVNVNGNSGSGTSGGAAASYFTGAAYAPSNTTFYGGAGGNAGSYGQAGSAGGTVPNTWYPNQAMGNGNNGGAAGAAVEGNSFITWINQGAWAGARI